MFGIILCVIYGLFTIFLKNLAQKLDAFLKFNEQEILEGSGKVSHAVAVALVEADSPNRIREVLIAT